MLSVLIPTYNFDCTALVERLAASADQLLGRERYEVLIFDDASTASDTRKANADLARANDSVHYVLQTQNLGRAHNRNALFRSARFPHLLFLDCDAMPAEDDFLERLMEERNEADVVCPRIVTPAPPAPRGCELRFRYEHAATRRRTAAYRSAHPYLHFSTFCMLTKKEVVTQLQFDERCTDYGFEDTLFGLQLQEQGFSVRHVDLPVVHTGIDRNEDFLRKSETALRTLQGLSRQAESLSGIARMAARLDHLRARRATAALLAKLMPRLRRNLLGHRPSLMLFQLYKLAFYLNLPPRND